MEMRKPFKPAAFSPCLPNPYPPFSRLPPLLHESKSGLSEPTPDFPGLISLILGRIGFESERHCVIERFDLARSRKMRPRRILRHPSAKRKNAETRLKSSTWWERMAAPRRHWKIPRAPSPNVGPRTGKKRSKKAIGQPISERKRMMTWKMMNSRLMIAQKTPAA